MNHKQPCLVISSKALPRAAEIAEAAIQCHWSVAWDIPKRPLPRQQMIYYGALDDAERFAKATHAALLEPPLDLLARISPDLLLRNVKFTQFSSLPAIGGRWFVKPADPIHKIFDYGVHRDIAAIEHRRPIPPETPVLLSEPVEWISEFRVWVHDRRVVTTSAYMSFGMPLVHRPGSRGLTEPKTVVDFAQRVLATAGVDWPPAFVMDVGYIDQRGHAVVEFNPIWSSGLLGGDPAAILPALQSACVPRDALTPALAKWSIRA